MKVLLLEAGSAPALALRTPLAEAGHTFVCASMASDPLAELLRADPDVVVIDLRATGGLTLAQRALELAAPSRLRRLESENERLESELRRWCGVLDGDGHAPRLRDRVKAFEKEHIERALASTGGHRARTADVLGISRKVLWEKMRDHGLLERKRPDRLRKSASRTVATAAPRR